MDCGDNVDSSRPAGDCEGHQRANADRQRSLVDAKLCTMSRVHGSLRFVANSEPDVHAGNALRKIREIFRAHRRRHLRYVKGRVLAHVVREAFRKRNVIDDRRVAAHDSNFRSCAVCCSGVLGDTAHARLQSVTNVRIVRAKRSRHADFVGDNVVTISAFDRADRNDDALERIRLARSDVLQCENDSACGGNRVDRGVRIRSMSAFTVNRDVELVRRCIDGSGRNSNRAGWNAMIDVQHGNRFDVRVVEDASFDHRLCTARSFFRRLKHQYDGAMQSLAHRLQFARGSEQHRGVCIVSAGVHSPSNF